MYSNVKSVQYLVAALKKYQIRTVVVSAGNSHNAIVRSLEEDDYFRTFSIVDERSAAFFACGIAQELDETIAICCTAGTAAINYLSGITEAFHRGLKIVAITADKNPYYVGQNEDQTIDQLSPFKTITKYSCRLPIVQTDQDEWYCQRLLNEALLELDHHGTGPVHIDVPIEAGMFAINDTFTTEELPEFNKIERYDLYSENIEWDAIFSRLKNKRILILSGQNTNPSSLRADLFEDIFKRFNCVIATDKLSNLHCKGTIEAARASRVLSRQYELLVPDVVISLYGNVTDYKFPLKSVRWSYEHWIITPDGIVRDPFKRLTKVFEGSVNTFLQKMALFGDVSDESYYKIWEENTKKFKVSDLDYSNAYAVKELMRYIPAGANFNIGNSSPIRLAQLFDLNPEVSVFCNRGVNGIDGCVSTFIGQAVASKEKINFLLVGDLTFFYDMNSIWNRYVGNNIRIMLTNNSGASLFHFNQGLKQYPTLNENVAAEHFAQAKQWVEAQGFKYLCAHNKEEFNRALEDFVCTQSEKPIFFEVFTHKELDADVLHRLYDDNMLPASYSPQQDDGGQSKESLGKRTKEAVKILLGEELVNKIRNIKK